MVTAAPISDDQLLSHPDGTAIGAGADAPAQLGSFREASIGAGLLTGWVSRNLDAHQRPSARTVDGVLPCEPI